MTAPANVYIVDDDAAVRRGLQALLQVKGYAVRTFASAEVFLAALPVPPGCVLLDLLMPGMSGLALQAELKRRAIHLPLIVITGHGDVPAAVAALKAGAADFLEKPFDSDVVLASLAAALDAPTPAGDAAIAAALAQLTPREQEVMQLVIAGRTNKAIAHQLGIALRTVEIHRGRVMEKTGARNLSELIRLMLRLTPP